MLSHELRKELIWKYPKIYDKDFIFEHLDGWSWLIDRLSLYLQYLTDHRNVPQVEAAQVKEKFGTLRFYYDGGNEMAEYAIRFAEWLSGYVCEKCGSYWAYVHDKDGWYMTRCQRCLWDQNEGDE
jgi:hypothetical protein